MSKNNPLAKAALAQCGTSPGCSPILAVKREVCLVNDSKWGFGVETVERELTQFLTRFFLQDFLWEACQLPGADRFRSYA